MRLRVTGGVLVTPQGRRAADLVAENGTVIRLAEPGRAGPADEEIDVSGCLVFPGFIDPHVHSRDPGATEKEDFAHATLAAVCGGVTTIFDMPNTVPPLDTAPLVATRAAMHEGRAWADFGLWGMSLGAENLAEIRAMVRAGVVGIKLYWGYALDRASRSLVYETEGRPPESLLPPPSTAEVYDLLREVAAADGLLAVHCEERGVLDSAARALGRPVRDYADLLAARPDVAEAAAIALAAEMAGGIGCRLHVVHLSSARGVRVVRQAQAAGIAISAETCPQYLTLTDADYPRLGSRLKTFPLVRTALDRETLWAAIADGTITSVGSDHAPHTREQKEQSLAEAPAGVIGVETLATVMLGEMTAGRISPERLCWVLSEGTARLYRVYPRKGALLPSSDCDLTVVDPEAEWSIDEARLHSRHRLSPWHGWKGRGRPRLAVLRGEVVMREGEPVGRPRGRLVAPQRAVECTG